MSTGKIFYVTVFIMILFISSDSVEFTESVLTSSLDDLYASPLFHVNTAATTAPIGLTPLQIKTAYNLPLTGGSGTIAIICAFDNPMAENDLNTFSRAFSLPAPIFEKVIMSPTMEVNSLWALEASLDVQWAHAIAPNAKILLVEAKTNLVKDLLEAIDYATNRPDVVAVSMSWGAAEFPTETTYNNYFTSSYGATFFAASGDNGAGVMWPSSSANVIAVGGTYLSLNSDGTFASETAWSGSGGGLSAYEPEPAYQVTYNIPNTDGKRAVPDVSYNADPNSGVPVYCSISYLGETGWFQIGGTSAGAPQWAAIQALGHSASNNNFYQNAKYSNAYFRDIIGGSNGAYIATLGFDLVTGLGSPLTWSYITGTKPDFTISANPSTLNIEKGTLEKINVTVTPIGGFLGTISLTTSAPTDWNASFNPATITFSATTPGSSILSLMVDPNAIGGICNLTIVGSSGQLIHNTSVAVNVIAAQTAPSAPQNLIATGGSSEVHLNWSAPLNNGGSPITGYSVYRSSTYEIEVKVATITENSLSYVDTTVTNGQTYHYQVTANNTVGESVKSNEANATPLRIANVTMNTSKVAYSKWSYVTINATVTDIYGTPIQGVLFNATLYDIHNFTVWSSSNITDINGKTQFNYLLAFDAKFGTYTLAATMSLNEYRTENKQTSFLSIG